MNPKTFQLFGAQNLGLVKYIPLKNPDHYAKS